ncbi:MAG: hypothetical protein QW331_02945 [Candidatus Woesearchaeota archaeon]
MEFGNLDDLVRNLEDEDDDVIQAFIDFSEIKDSDPWVLKGRCNPVYTGKVYDDYEFRMDKRGRYFLYDRSNQIIYKVHPKDVASRLLEEFEDSHDGMDPEEFAHLEYLWEKED